MNEPLDSKGKISRRAALQISAAGCTGTIVASSMPTKLFANSKFPMRKWSRLVSQDFEVLGRSFEKTPANFKRVKLRLVEISELKTKPQPNQVLPDNIPKTSLSLMFEGEMRTQLPSATYIVNHQAIGKVNLFINERQPETSLRRFESILS